MRVHFNIPRPTLGAESDSLRRGNGRVAEIIARYFELAPADRADLIVEGNPEALTGTGPPRLVLAGGAISDPCHWARTFPRLRTCDILVAESASDLRIVDKLAGRPFCHVWQLPRAIDPSTFFPDSTLRKKARRQLSLPDGAPLLLTVSAVNPQKNVHGAIHLLAAAARLGCEAHLGVVGRLDSDYFCYLEDLATRYGVIDRLHILGPLRHEQMNEVYNSADLFVHLCWTWKEGFGNALLEAHACGLPALAADWNGFCDVVHHEHTGYLASTWLADGERRVNWGCLVRPCVNILSNQQRRMELSLAARRRALSDFAPAALEDRLVSCLYEWLQQSSRHIQRANLSDEGLQLALAVALEARRQPAGTESKHIAHSLAAGVSSSTEVGRTIHKAMATYEEPPRPTARSVFYRLVDCHPDPTDETLWHLVEPPWERTARLTPQAAWVLQRLSQSTASPDQLAQLAGAPERRALEAALDHLVETGLVGLLGG